MLFKIKTIILDAKGEFVLTCQIIALFANFSLIERERNPLLDIKASLANFSLKFKEKNLFSDIGIRSLNFSLTIIPRISSRK